MKYKKFYNYRIYENGTIFSEITNKKLKPDNNNGYYQITLFLNKKKFRIKVHRLVCHLFNGMELNSEKVVDHIDGNKKNNHYRNLEAVTTKENNKRARDLKLNNLNKQHNGNSKKCYKINNETFYSWEIAEKFNLSVSTIFTYKSKNKKFFIKNNIEILK